MRNNQLHGRLKDFYGELKSHREAILKAIGLVETIAQATIEENLKTILIKLPAQITELVLKGMPISMDYERRIYTGFLKGKSVREWSYNTEEMKII